MSRKQIPPIMAPKNTARKHVLEANKATVMAMIIEGAGTMMIARRFGVSDISVQLFKRRYAMEISQALFALETRIQDLAIADKAKRIAAKDQRWQLLEYVRKEKAAGRSGLDSGLVNKTYRIIGSGEDAQMVEEYRIDDALLRGMEAAEHSAAEELGHLPKQGDVYAFQGENQQFNVNLFDRQQGLALARAIMQVTSKSAYTAHDNEAEEVGSEEPEDGV
jgi:hypothetical protein